MNDQLQELTVDSIPLLVQERGPAPMWLDSSGSRSWRNFGAATEVARLTCLNAGVLPGEVVITPADADFDALPWLFGAAAVGAVVVPLRSARVGEIGAWAEFIEIGWRVANACVVRVGVGTRSTRAASLWKELRQRDHPGLILATGGTTGTPKLVLHDLAALLATIHVKESQRRRILPLMRFDHIGGLDAAWRALAGGHVLVSPPREITPDSVAATIARHQVEVLPATPSFLNLLLTAGVDRTHDLGSLRVVPYGAEPMPPRLLERLQIALPRVEFVQRFGTSETGALPVRELGAGLELRSDENGFAWKVVGEELWVRSPARALGYLSGGGDGFDANGWFRTGDLVEQLTNGSIRVLGRREELINVGGEKVLPGEVESALLAHPLVADCRVSSKTNTLLGQIVAADIVWRGEERNALVVKRMLHEFAGGIIARHKLPVSVSLVSAIEATSNLKKRRGLVPA